MWCGAEYGVSYGVERQYSIRCSHPHSVGNILNGPLLKRIEALTACKKETVLRDRSTVKPGHPPVQAATLLVKAYQLHR